MTPPTGLGETFDGLKRFVMLDPLFQKALEGVFLAGRAGGASDFELAALLHAQVCRMFMQMEPGEQEAICDAGEQYVGVLYALNDEVV